jgi:hypothetical protein
MPSGKQCHGYALRGEDLCYFHRRQHLAAQKPASANDSIEIPLLEDRCAIQVTITQVLRAIVANTIDRPRASLLLYGLQLALQSVDRKSWAIPVGTVEALSHTSDGDELAVDPDGYEDEDDDEEEDSDEAGGGDDEDDDDEDDDEDDDGLDNELPGGRQTTRELIAGAKYLESVGNVLDAGDMRQVARLLKE